MANILHFGDFAFEIIRFLVKPVVELVTLLVNVLDHGAEDALFDFLQRLVDFLSKVRNVFSLSTNSGRKASVVLVPTYHAVVKSAKTVVIFGCSFACFKGHGVHRVFKSAQAFFEVTDNSSRTSPTFAALPGRSSGRTPCLGGGLWRAKVLA